MVGQLGFEPRIERLKVFCRNHLAIDPKALLFVGRAANYHTTRCELTRYESFFVD